MFALRPRGCWRTFHSAGVRQGWWTDGRCCSNVAGGLSAATLNRIHHGFVSLREVLDEHVVGQATLKEAILLGLLAREHVYIEGPPGVAKTYMAELISGSSSLTHWFYQMHRDTRLSEIIGEAIITKEATAKGDVIRQDVIRGGILTCELAVLDDISRAPGEALNVLLRILNERKYGVDAMNRIPLLSAIATGNPAHDDAYYAEPLDPATLDRFALQVRVKGLINEGDWDSAAEVIDIYGAVESNDSTETTSSTPKLVCHRDLILEAGALLPEVLLGQDAKRALLDLLRTLHQDHKLGEENSLLTDRTFLIKAVKIMKAYALLQGRGVCKPADLVVIRYLTTFRVPAKVHDNVDHIIAGVLKKFESDPNSSG